MQFDELLALYTRRQSCREFSDRPLEEETVRAICEAALLAPSACNAQPWRLVAVMGEKKDEVVKCMQSMGMNKFASKAQAAVVIAEGKSGGLLKVSSAFKENEFLRNDLGILTAHLILAAESLGVGSCILGWRNEEKLREILQLGKKTLVPEVVVLGYPAEEYPVREKKRKPLDETFTLLK